MFDQTFFRDLARKIFWIWFDNISLPQIKNNLMMRLNARIERALISQAQEWGGGGGGVNSFENWKDNPLTVIHI